MESPLLGIIKTNQHESFVVAVAPTERGSKEVCVCVCIEDLGKQGKRECSS